MNTTTTEAPITKVWPPPNSQAELIKYGEAIAVLSFVVVDLYRYDSAVVGQTFARPKYAFAGSTPTQYNDVSELCIEQIPYFNCYQGEKSVWAWGNLHFFLYIGGSQTLNPEAHMPAMTVFHFQREVEGVSWMTDQHGQVHTFVESNVNNKAQEVCDFAMHVAYDCWNGQIDAQKWRRYYYLPVNMRRLVMRALALEALRRFALFVEDIGNIPASFCCLPSDFEAQVTPKHIASLMRP